MRLLATLFLCLCALFATPARAAEGTERAVREAPTDSHDAPSAPAWPGEAPEEEDDTGGEDDLVAPSLPLPPRPAARPVRRARRAALAPSAPVPGTLFRPPRPA